MSNQKEVQNTQPNQSTFSVETTAVIQELPDHHHSQSSQEVGLEVAYTSTNAPTFL